jgi:hypothetical protein
MRDRTGCPSDKVRKLWKRFAPICELCSLYEEDSSRRCSPSGVNTLWCLEGWRDKLRIFTTRDQLYPYGPKFAPMAKIHTWVQSSHMVPKFTPGDKVHTWRLYLKNLFQGNRERHDAWDVLPPVTAFRAMDYGYTRNRFYESPLRATTFGQNFNPLDEFPSKTDKSFIWLLCMYN